MDKTPAIKKNMTFSTAKKKPVAAPKPFDFTSLTDDSTTVLRLALSMKTSQENSWRGDWIVPPGTLVERIINEFKSQTNIPLELPFFTFMHYVGAYLIENDIATTVNGERLQADFWTILLAGSGAGKTYTHGQIKEALGDKITEIDGTGAVSSRAFIDELVDKNGRGLWLRDEIAQFMKQINTSGNPLSDMKDYLLRIYDNNEITRKTKDSTLTVPNPVIGILGFNATESFIANISSESLVDGFAQRFGYVIAKDDPTRRFQDYPIWSLDKQGWGDEWHSLTSGIRKDYAPTAAALNRFNMIFKSMVSTDIPESFYRRILWKAHKYALIFHIISGKADVQEIDQHDYGWAARVLHMHISDTCELLSQTGKGDMMRIVEKCEKVIIKLKAEGKEVTPRVLLQRVKDLGTAANAKFVFDLLGVHK